MDDMKLTVQVRLLPTESQIIALTSTLQACNAAANWLSARMFEGQIFRKYDAHRLFYAEVRTKFGLSAQPTIRVIGKVSDAYTRSRATQHRWRTTGGQPFDARCLSWQVSEAGPSATISIWTTVGRIKGLRIAGSPRQLALVRTHKIGETDLIFRNGKWLLLASIELQDKAYRTPTGFLGVDLGIVNITTTSDGIRERGSYLLAYRRRQVHLRQRLQKKGTSSARRLLDRRRRKETLFVANINHIVSKRIVTVAQRTGRGIAVEQLTGIRERVRLRKPQRVMMHTWAFHQLGQFLSYKAKLAGVPFVQVNPAYTSQTCSTCGFIDKKNRRSQAQFTCGRCGFVEHADHNAARNIAFRGVVSWGEIMRPDAAPTPAASRSGSSKPIGSLSTRARTAN